MQSHQPAGRAERVVVTSHPLAAAAAHDILAADGTVVDAAVAAAAVLTVVDPRSTGIGGDLFAMVWPSGAGAPIGLNAAGGAPAGMTVEALRERGYRRMPQEGPWSITVPGAVAGWRALLDRFGRLDVGRILDPAVSAASAGFRVTPVVAGEWAGTSEKLKRNQAAAETFLTNGRPPGPGELWSNPPYARTLERLSGEGLDAFYRGEIPQRIADAVQAAGGPLRLEDIAGWNNIEWVQPLTTRFGGLTVHELPPPGQGLVALMAIALYGLDGGDTPVDADHVAIEALKLAFADASARLADPTVVDVPMDELLAPNRLKDLRDGIDMRHATSGTRIGPPTDTVYLAVVDTEQGGCSLIQSLYDGFGSGVGVPGLGFTLQNRGGCFELDPGHPNAPAPGKRPYHTIIPAMLSDDGAFAGCLGVVGGFMQPQGHLQVLRNVVERGMPPQEAVDAPRLRVYSGTRVGLEPGYNQHIIRELAQRGHDVDELPVSEAGGAQLILRTADGFTGGSDRRKDGHVGSQ